MRSRLFALVGLTAGFGLSAYVEPPKIEYKDFASAAGKYVVLFPGPVKTETTEVKAASGSLTLTLDSVEVAGTLFLVTYIDTPDEVAKKPTGPRLEKVRDAAVGKDGKIVTDKEVEVGVEKHPGREVVIQKPKTHLRTRIVIAGSRLYQVMIEGTKEFVLSADAAKFFDSFDVTK